MDGYKRLHDYQTSNAYVREFKRTVKVWQIPVYRASVANKRSSCMICISWNLNLINLIIVIVVYNNNQKTCLDFVGKILIILTAQDSCWHELYSSNMLFNTLKLHKDEIERVGNNFVVVWLFSILWFIKF